jgi:hypothetical protein
MKKIPEALRSCRLSAAGTAPIVSAAGKSPPVNAQGDTVMHVPKSIVPKDSQRVVAGVTAGIGGLLRAALARLPFAQYEGYVGAYAEYYRDEYALGRRERTEARSSDKTCPAA